MEASRPEHLVLADKDFRFICQYVYDVAGIVLNDSKREMVYRRLTRIIRDRKIASFSEYCQLLRAKPEVEQNYFINAITTNLTSFFRENHHFEFLIENELPKLIKIGNKKLRIWSAACSTGEEPYSIAMTLLNSMAGQLPSWDAKILATDIDSNVLSKAKEGIYQDKDGQLKQEDKLKHFQRGLALNAEKIKVKSHVQNLITFKQLNLLHEWPMKGEFDIIFCRNVIIYFDKETQQDLFQRFYHALKPGGLLILGHSESLGRCQEHFENVGRTIFRKPW